MDRTLKKCTIYDVAKETNLSIATVSRVINQKGNYSKKTEDKVLTAIQKLEYIPSSSAKSLASNTNNSIGLFIDLHSDMQFDGSYYNRFMIGVFTAAMQRDYNILLVNNQMNLINNGTTPSNFNLYNYNCSGFIFPEVSNIARDMVNHLMKKNYPVVYTGILLPFDTKKCNVFGGYNQYKYAVLELLYNKGYRNIVVFESFSQSANMSRIELCRSIVEEFRLKNNLSPEQCRMVIYDLNERSSFLIQLEALLKGSNPPEVIYIDNKMLCVTAYNLIQQLDIKIPDDIGIISTSHRINGGTEFSPPLSIVFVNAYQMGYNAASLLINQIEGIEDFSDNDVPFQIIENESLKNYISGNQSAIQ